MYLLLLPVFLHSNYIHDHCTGNWQIGNRKYAEIFIQVYLIFTSEGKFSIQDFFLIFVVPYNLCIVSVTAYNMSI